MATYAIGLGSSNEGRLELDKQTNQFEPLRVNDKYEEAIFGVAPVTLILEYGLSTDFCPIRETIAASSGRVGLCFDDLRYRRNSIYILKFSG
jgi:hypothetical protein